MEQGADFQQILSSPTEAYAEGLRFFMGKGLLNNALRSVASDLEAHGIDYSVIGAIALNQHGYRRFTEDIDLLLTKEGLEKFREELIGLGYRPAFEGSTKTFRDRKSTRLNSSHRTISYAVFCLKKKKKSKH